MGILQKKYRLALLGLWLDRSKFLKTCLIHKDNPALLALLVELDSKAESSQEKEKLEQLFNPPLYGASQMISPRAYQYIPPLSKPESP